MRRFPSTCSLRHLAGLGFQAALVWGGLGCAAGERPAKEFGLLPSAVTTAVPEWLPRRVMAGTEVASDGREVELGSLRRLTQGFDVVDLAYAQRSRTLYAVMRGPSDERTRLYRLAVGETGASPVALTPATEEVLAVASAAESEHVIYAVSTQDGAELREQVAGGAVRTLGVAGQMAGHSLAVSPTGDRFFFATTEPPAAGAGVGRAFVLELARAGGRKRLVEVMDKPSGSLEIDLARAKLFLGLESGLLTTSDEGMAASRLAFGSISGIANVPNAGQLLLSARHDSEQAEIYRLPLATQVATAAQRLTFSHADFVTCLDDCRWVAFASRRLGSTSDLYAAPWHQP